MTDDTETPWIHTPRKIITKGGAERILDGIAIILKYDRKAEVCLEHDVMHCGHGTSDKMTEKDKSAMADLGWVENPDGEDNDWVMFV